MEIQMGDEVLFLRRRFQICCGMVEKVNHKTVIIIFSGIRYLIEKELCRRKYS